MEFPIKMYKISLKEKRIKVVCSICNEKGFVNPKCKKCGGAGTHNKTLKVWEVDKNTETVERIDRMKDPARGYY